jgi:long-chain acyl-CoA synthetase
MLAAVARAAPRRPALQFEGRSLDYGGYLRCVAGFARELIEAGAGGSRVALVCANSMEVAIATFAVHAAGGQVVPLNPIYTRRELAYILADADPAAVVYDEAVAGTVEPLIAERGIRCAIAVGGERGRRLDVWRDDVACELPRPLPAGDTPAALLYTGGTTGVPKGVDLSHRQMAINLSQRQAVVPFAFDGERILCVMPMFHTFAIAICLHTAVYCRGLSVILPRYRPDLVLEAIERQRITVLPAGPTVFIGLMQHERFGTTDLSSLRMCISGSAPLSEETLKAWEQKTGCHIYEGYGLTESGPVLSFNPVAGETRPGSVGIVLPDTEIEIVDAETGEKTLPAGERGEIRARGPQLMRGYRNKPEETARALRDGWLYTGDIGEFDADGYLYIRDRKKDMAIVGGYNVYPREVDEVLYAHPAVREAAAVGVPDSYRGEVIKAWVVLKPDSRASAEELLGHCRANLARYKVPVAIEVVEELPKTPVGKIDKKALRAAPQSEQST